MTLWIDRRQSVWLASCQVAGLSLTTIRSTEGKPWSQEGRDLEFGKHISIHCGIVRVIFNAFSHLCNWQVIKSKSSELCSDTWSSQHRNINVLKTGWLTNMGTGKASQESRFYHRMCIYLFMYVSCTYQIFSFPVTFTKKRKLIVWRCVYCLRVASNLTVFKTPKPADI